MDTFKIFQLMLFTLLAVAGTAVVLTRNPKRQLLIAGIYGLFQAILFYMVHSPDVALSALAVGVIGLPVLVLFTLAKLEKSR